MAMIPRVIATTYFLDYGCKTGTITQFQNWNWSYNSEGYGSRTGIRTEMGNGY